MYNRNSKSSGHRFLECSPSVSHYCHQHCHPASLRPETTLPTPPGDRCLVSLIRGPGWAVPTTPTITGLCTSDTSGTSPARGQGSEANPDPSSYCKKAVERHLDSTPYSMPDCQAIGGRTKRPELCRAETLPSPTHCARPLQPPSHVPTARCRHSAKLVSCAHTPGHLQEN